MFIFYNLQKKKKKKKKKNLFTLYRHIFVMYRSQSVAVVDRNYIWFVNVKAFRPGMQSVDPSNEGKPLFLSS